MVSRRVAVFCLVSVGAALTAATAVAAERVYQWVDADGVRHYSDSAPPDALEDVRVLELASTNPPDFDPHDYHYSILNQEQRTAALRKKRQREEEERLARRRELAAYRETQSVVYIEEPYRDDYYYSGYYFQRRYHPHHRKAHRKFRHGHHFARNRQLPQFDQRRFAHPARSHRRPGAHLRFGLLGQRVTHRSSHRSVRAHRAASPGGRFDMPHRGGR